MTTISQNTVGINTNNFESTQAKKAQTIAPPKTEDKGMSKAMKAGIGVGALAVITLAGLAIHGKIKTKQLNNLKGTAERIENSIRDALAHQDEKTKALFNPELMESHIEAAKNLPLKEQVKELKNISAYAHVNYGRLFDNKDSMFVWLRPPELSKEILETKDQYLIAEEFFKLQQNRLFDSKTQGKTIQETVEKVFGKGSEIRPHTYDLSKEANFIETQETISGYKTFRAKKDGKYEYLGPVGGTVCGSVKTNYNVFHQQGYEVATQKLKGKPIVCMRINEGGASGIKEIYLCSPNGEMTPMQKDLLSLNGKLTPEDINVYKDIFGKGNNVNHDDPFALSGDRNYDGIASFVQSMAEKYRQ